MNTRLMMLAAIVFTAVFAVACASSGDNGATADSGKTGETGQGGGNGGSSKSPADPADSMIQMYKDGHIKASPFFPIHDFVFVGQTWTVESDFGAGKQTETWQIASTAARGVVIIEHITAQGFILAYEVNAWADAGKPNVQKAWIGKSGEKPHEIKIMDLKDAQGGEAEEPGFVLRGKFSNVELGGKKWNGETIEVRDAGQVSKTWIADDGWFTRMIRMDLNGKTVIKLTEARTNARIKPALDWS